MKTITEIKEAQFEALVLNEALPVAVVFYAPWSRHCEGMEPVFESAAEAAGDSAKFFRINVSKNTDLSGWYGVECIPTVLYFRGGQIVGKVVGVASKEDVLSNLKSGVEAGGEEDRGLRIEDRGTDAGGDVEGGGRIEKTSNPEHGILNIEGTAEHRARVRAQEAILVSHAVLMRN